MYSEVKLYVTSDAFTQMVWDSTTHVGCAKSTDNTNMVLVCNYYPRGNVDGQYTNNVAAVSTADTNRYNTFLSRQGITVITA